MAGACVRSSSERAVVIEIPIERARVQRVVVSATERSGLARYRAKGKRQAGRGRQCTCACTARRGCARRARSLGKLRGAEMNHLPDANAHVQPRRLRCASTIHLPCHTARTHSNAEKCANACRCMSERACHQQSEQTTFQVQGWRRAAPQHASECVGMGGFDL